jgi:hypothetical protein
MGTAQAKRLDLIGHRGLPFLADFVFLDNLTGMTACEFSLRNHPDNPSSLILLALASGVGEGVHLLYATTDTVANHILAGYLATEILKQTNPVTGDPYDLGDTIDLSVIRVIIAVLDSRIPAPQEQGDDWIGSYDLVPTPPGLPIEKRAFGQFTVKPRANIS